MKKSDAAKKVLDQFVETLVRIEYDLTFLTQQSIVMPHGDTRAQALQKIATLTNNKKDAERMVRIGTELIKQFRAEEEKKIENIGNKKEVQNESGN
jgi:hypothetical protein